MKKKDRRKVEEQDESLKLAWLDYRKSVCDTQSKSQDDFEKYINLIASGGLGLTITFFDKLTPLETARFIWIIAIGWMLLALTLLSNLYSHYKSAKFSEETIICIDNEDYDGLTINNKKSNKIINTLNKVSLYSLFFGIVAIIIFVVINMNSMSDKNSTPQPSQHPQPSQPPRPLTEEKGRTLPPPPQNRPNNNPNNK